MLVCMLACISYTGCCTHFMRSHLSLRISCKTLQTTCPCQSHAVPVSACAKWNSAAGQTFCPLESYCQRPPGPILKQHMASADHHSASAHWRTLLRRGCARPTCTPRQTRQAARPPTGQDAAILYAARQLSITCCGVDEAGWSGHLQSLTTQREHGIIPICYRKDQKWQESQVDHPLATTP